jgi:cytochrome c-type biogenesis protein CcmH/NrfG
VRRSLALIALGVAVAVAAAVVVAGMNSGGGEAAGASGDASTGASSPGALPSGHPSIAADQDEVAPDTDAEAGDAIAQLETRRAEDPQDVAVLLDLGNAYFMNQRLTQAEQVYSQALALEPDSAAAQVGLAMVWHAQGDSKRAEAALRAVLKEHPDDQDAHYSLAIVYFSAGHIDDARVQWETAAGIDPSSTTGRRSQSFVDLLEDRQSSAPETNQ